MKNSKFFSLKWIDFVKGLIISVLTTVVSCIYNLIQAGHFPTDGDWKKIALAAASSFCAYLLKNLFTNSQDQFGKGENQ